MQKRKPGNDSFGAFLKKLESNQTQNSAPAAGNGAFPIVILQTLAEKGPLPVADLLKYSRMSVLDLSSALSSMRDLKLVEVSRESDDHDEIVRLSPGGKSLVMAQAR